MSLPAPPKAEKRANRIEQLGRVRQDEYAWLKDENWQAVMRDPSALRPDIRAHLEAENAYTAALLASTGELQAKIFEEMKGRIKEDDASVPSPDGPFEYYSRYETGAQHPILARRARDGAGREEVLIDIDAMAKPHAYFQVAHAEHSPDHALYAWAEDDQGSEYYRIRVKNLATRGPSAMELLFGPIESSTGDFVFSPDSEWLFWTWRDEHGRPAKIFRRPMAGGPDVLVYEEKDPGFFIGVGRTASRQWLVIGAGNQETSEAWLIPAADPTSAPRLVEPRKEGVRYDVDHWNDRFVIRTNADDAVDFKLVEAAEKDPSRKGWKDLVPHRPGVFLIAAQPYRDWLVRIERVDVNNRIIVTAKDGSEHVVGFDEEAYALGLEGGFEYATDTVRFVYTSPTTPRQWFDYDMATRGRTLRKTQEIPSGHDPAKYETKRLHATAPDGASVPITVLKLKETPLDGSAPLLLYGYGSYGHSLDAGFSIRHLSLVDRGWIWAVAHVRGGSEKGWGWFLDGRKEKKTNTFTDFVASAEALIAKGYGSKGRIVCYGGSAGGLLVGAVVNLRPDLWGGAIAAVPFVDALNTMSDVSLPLTPPEWPEWGNPLEDPAAYDLIASYAPYEQVKAEPYPPILATGGLSDPRVTYWEPAKWIARLRDRTTGSAPMLLKINLEAGHGGASGRFDFLKEIALDYAFAVWAIDRGWERA
jgi:oligopeptidase B